MKTQRQIDYCNSLKSDYSRETMIRFNLDQIEMKYKQGLITDPDLEWYLAEWNKTPGRFTRAYWRDGAIRQQSID